MEPLSPSSRPTSLNFTRRRALGLLGAGAAGLALGPRLGAQDGAGATAPEKGMLIKAIPSSGEALPVIGLGTWQVFAVGNSAAERAPQREVLAAFAELGGKVIDSSPMYGTSEDVAGDLIRELGVRDKMFIATKVWTRGEQEGIAQMETSMKLLGVKSMDLMQVHNLVDVETHLATLREWKAAGRVRYIGITHYTAGAHREVVRVLEKHPVDFVQINYSLAEREAEKSVLPAALDKGVAVICNRPFSGGDLFARLRQKPLPDFAAEIDCTSWAQLMLKFIVSHPAVTCAIPATSKVRHLRDNMGAARGRLPDEALRTKILAAVEG